MRCVEEEDAARGVVGRRDPTTIYQTVHWIVESLCGKESARGSINSIDVPGFDSYGDKRNLFANLPQGIAASLASHKPGFCKLEAYHRVVERPAPKLSARRSVLDHHNRTPEVRDSRQICMSEPSP
jgi:hypothetical protein